MGYRQRSLGSTFKFKCIYSMIILFELQIFIIQITKMISIIFKKLKDIVMSSAKTAALIKRRRASQKNNLMISFYVFLPFFILMAIVALKWNKMKIFWNKEGTLSGE